MKAASSTKEAAFNLSFEMLPQVFQGSARRNGEPSPACRPRRILRVGRRRSFAVQPDVWLACHSRATVSNEVWALLVFSFFSAEGSVPPLNCFLASAQASRASLRESWGYEGQQIFMALKTVLQAPAFRAAGSYEKKQTVAVKELLGFACGLCAA